MLHDALKFAQHNPTKAGMYFAGALIGLYLAYVILAVIVVACMALYAHYGKGQRADRFRNWIIDMKFVREQLEKASPEKIAKFGGKRNYKKMLKLSVAGARFQMAVDEAVANAQKTKNA